MSKSFGVCEPRIERDRATGETHVYYCGRTLAARNAGIRVERCLGGVHICPDCFGDFEDFTGRSDRAREGGE